MEAIITTHAKVRSKQRGTSQSAVRAILKYADIEMPTHSGCKRLQVSHAAVRLMMSDGVALKDIDAAKKTILVVDEKDRVVTVMKMNGPDRRGRMKRVRFSRTVMCK